MKKLWLSTLTASLILGAVSFSAGVQARDHYDRDDWHGHREYRHERHCDDWRGGYRVAYRDYRPVYYRPAPVVYYRPEYYPAPVYRERVRYDNDIHGSISIGF